MVDKSIATVLQLEDIQKSLREQLPHLKQSYGIDSIGIFGSYVRGEARPDSDVDLLIELQESTELDLLDLVRLEDELTNLLTVKADIALKRNLRKRIGQKILQEVITL